MSVPDIIDNINRLAGDRNWEVLNTYLNDARFTQITDAEIVAYMRTTYPVRTALADWPERLIDAKLTLRMRRGEIPAEMLLKGL